MLAQEPREKLEMYPNYTFICFRSFEIEVHSGNLRPFNFYIFIFKNGLLTVSENLALRYCDYPATTYDSLSSISVNPSYQPRFALVRIRLETS